MCLSHWYREEYAQTRTVYCFEVQTPSGSHRRLPNRKHTKISAVRLACSRSIKRVPGEFSKMNICNSSPDDLLQHSTSSNEPSGECFMSTPVCLTCSAPAGLSGGTPGNGLSMGNFPVLAFNISLLSTVFFTVGDEYNTTFFTRASDGEGRLQPLHPQFRFITRT